MTMCDAATLRLVLDAAALGNSLSALADAANRSPEVRKALLDALDSGVELVCLYVDDLSAAAGQLRIRAQLADRFAQLVFASGCMAGDCAKLGATHATRQDAAHARKAQP